MCIRDRNSGAEYVVKYVKDDNQKQDTSYTVKYTIEGVEQAADTLTVTGTASVSYTHLDVYKRQTVRDTRKIREHSRRNARRPQGACEMGGCWWTRSLTC